MKKGKKHGQCIFCNGYGLTKQHVIPDWIKKANILTLKKDHQVYRLQILPGDFNKGIPESFFIKPDILPKQGPISSTKLRIVCNACNTGWMSKLEQESKPLITALITGKQNTVTAKESDLLSKWIMMTSVMQQFTDLDSVCTTYEERKTFKERMSLPPNWKIYIAFTNDPEWEFRRKNEYGAFMINPKLTASGLWEKKLIQTISFGLGKLFIISWDTQHLGSDFSLEKMFGDALSLIYSENTALQAEIKYLNVGIAEKIGASLTEYSAKHKPKSI